MRKAKAKEQENGYCATLDWPQRQSPDAFFGFLTSGAAGSVYYARSRYATGGGCSHYRILSVRDESGKKCADTIAWACFDGGDCNEVTRTWCQNADGSWSYRR